MARESTTLNIKRFPTGVLARAKAAAALQHITLREFIIKAAGDAAAREPNGETKVSGR